MSNRAVWNVRQRHEWLQSSIKGKRLKRRSRLRIGLEAALERKRPDQSSQSEQSEKDS